MLLGDGRAMASVGRKSRALGRAFFEGLSPAAAGGIAAVIVAVAVIASNDDDANGTNGSNGT